MFKLTSLNLNGIRSAASKGLQDWVAQSMPDCICVQELKAQAADMSGRFEEIAGLKGHFHFAEKKGYSGVGVYTRHEPSDVIVGYGSTEFDAEGRYVELRFDRPGRKLSPKLSIISCYFPSGSSGEERQAAKFRFLAEFYPRLLALKETRDFVLCGDVNIAHQEIDLKNFKGNKKNSGFLPEERAWMTELLRDAELANEAADELTERSGPHSRRRHGRRVPQAAAHDDRRGLHLVEQPRPGLCEERGLAPGLPPGHARLRGAGAQRAHLQGTALFRPRAHERGLK
jgi:exodeoxyribonuclease-3